MNWLNKDQTSGLRNLMISQYGYSQHIKDYTTVYETIIDHIYTNIPVYCVNVGILETYYSDHKAIWIAVKKELCKSH